MLKEHNFYCFDWIAMVIDDDDIDEDEAMGERTGVGNSFYSTTFHQFLLQFCRDVPRRTGVTK